MTKVANRAVETTSTIGTGTLDLDGAQTGFRSFADELTSGDTVYYLIEDDPDNPTVWEYGTGTFTAGSPNTLSRDTVIDSSNAGAKVSLTGTNTVTGIMPFEAVQQVGTDTFAGVFETATQAEQEAASAVDKAVTPGRQHFHDSAVKAWINGSYSAGVPQDDASYNVASLDDNGTGDVGINFSTAFSSANYVASLTLPALSASFIDDSHPYSKATTGIECGLVNNGTLTDTDFDVICVGDL